MLSIREICSAEQDLYNRFLSDALQTDKGSLVITAGDLDTTVFPTKDRPDNFTLGAFAEEELAAVVSFTREGEHREKLRHKGFVSTMYVAPAYRRQGIARKLMEELISRASRLPGLEQINLIVIADNHQAKRLYEQFGFTRYGTEPGSLKWEEKYTDEDLMFLRLG